MGHENDSLQKISSLGGWNGQKAECGTDVKGITGLSGNL